MHRIRKTIKCLLLLCALGLFAGTGCASMERARIIKSTKTDSCDLSEMGKNKYFHSSHYKRSIGRSVRKIHHKR